ncbi:glycosyltransferase family 9 protein [Bacteriovorax sp. Seq25_V]|uniref:glycosyltransferase family 9 protein n=1 Tax=Bacteriovorax sp. Seq25_V TaxID=1201288 RepID=UPI00038A1201|nr:glycosyltransferase family 9 protein [Bacteriovorax sp. Seq25_V]EQC46812.1 heptosyltransferase domain protein [Bacteriovorax sp. Seq25_V]
MKRHHLEKYARVLLTLDKIWLPMSKLSSFLKKNKKLKNNVLVLKLYEKGALALVSPLIHELENQGDDEVYFATLDLNEDALIFLPSIKRENIFLFNTTSFIKFIVSLFKYVMWSKSLGFKAVFNLDIFSNVSNVIMNFSFAGRRYRINQDDSDQSLAYNSKVHIYEHYSKLFNKYLKVESYLPSYPELFKETKEKIISLYLNTNDPLWQRSWTYQNWISLIERCESYYGDEYEIKVFAPYVEHDAIFLKYFSKYYQPTESLNLLMQKIAASTVFVTTDCGPSHFSAFCNTKTITLFGPESSSFFGSLSSHNTNISSEAPCSPCFNQYNKCISSCEDNVCMKNITVDRVMEYIRQSVGAYNVSA